MLESLFKGLQLYQRKTSTQVFFRTPILRLRKVASVHATGLFLCPLETSENQVTSMFSEERERGQWHEMG